jgi:DNA-binding winged helix-turn-helix (wHTH) protein/Tfp pilus assembly protein PilF
MTLLRDASEDSYAFGDYRVDAARRVLLHRGETAPLTPKAFDTLLVLVRQHGEVVGKDDLIKAVWPGRVVEENNLNQAIAALRRVLQDRRGENRYIETVSGQGYRFVADVGIVDPLPIDASAAPRLAVLPFENLTGDPGREYLADGLTEETIVALGRIDPQKIGVTSRTSVMAYKRATEGIARIARELGVAYTVEGTLQAEGERLRVTARLARTADQVQVWSASFDSEPRSMLEFQRELAGVIAQQVRLHLEPGRFVALGHRHPPNAEAFDAYLRGRHFWHQLTPATTRQALECFARATRHDPDYALAWSGIANAYAGMPHTGDAPPRDVSPRATEASERALRAQPDLAEVQASLGFRKFRLDWDWPGAEVALHRAIELDPSYWFSFAMLGHLQMHRGEVPESLATMRRSRELEPLLPLNHTLSAQVAFSARDFVLAAQFARQALSIDPDFWIGHFQLAQACVELGEHEVAQRALAEAGRTSGGNSKVVALRGYVHARQGRESEARQVLATLVALAGERFVPPCAMALVHVGLGDVDAAADCLVRALEARDVHLKFIPVDPKWEEARKAPRIAEILKCCGFVLAG